MDPTQSSLSLFSTHLDSTIRPNPEIPPHPHPHPQPLRNNLIVDDDDDDEENEIASSLDHFSTHLSPSLATPILSSTPKLGPLTQELVARLADLRHVDYVSAGPSRICLPHEIEELKSENAALKLQHEEYEREIARLRQQHENDKREITHLRTLQQQRQQQPQPAPLLPPPSSQQQQPIHHPPPDIGYYGPLLHVNPDIDSDNLTPYLSKKKKKKKRKREREREPPPQQPPQPAQQQPQFAPQRLAQQQQPRLAQQPRLTQQPPQPTQQQPRLAQQQPRPTQQQQQQTSSPSIHFFHDSNADDKFLTKENIHNAINAVNTKLNIPTTTYNIHKYATYELQQTFNRIKHITFNNNDIILLNILTNDARTTQRRPPKSLQQTKVLLSSIYDHLLSQLSPDKIILLESPPLLYEDIFPHAQLSHQMARQRGIRVAPTLLGEAHIKTWDGVHVLRGCHRLLANAIACAVLNRDPHRLFGLCRPPLGEFGPWMSPRGQGMAPPFSVAACAPPSRYRFRPRPIRSLMDIQIRGFPKIFP